MGPGFFSARANPLNTGKPARGEDYVPEILFVYCGGKVPKTREEIEEIEESASLWMKWFKKNG